MKELASELRTQGIPTGIITNGFNAIQEDKLKATGLDEVIEFMITSESAGTAKPDPAIFQMALDRYQITPEQAVMVGDNWDFDILGAVNANLPAIWFNRRRYPCPDPEQAYEIQTAEQLKSLIQPFLN
jgi:HAD superfamily hydrolase (TIGR01549 family)